MDKIKLLFGISLIFAMLVLVIGCKSDGEVNIGSKEAKEKMDANNNIIIIDVREPHEYDYAHIPNSILIPLGDLSLKSEGFDKNNEYILVCATGSRSGVATRYMKEQGFDKVYNLKEGIVRWPYELQKNQ